jgi:hypothetical protein
MSFDGGFASLLGAADRAALASGVQTFVVGVVGRNRRQEHMVGRTNMAGHDRSCPYIIAHPECGDHLSMMRDAARKAFAGVRLESP